MAIETNPKKLKLLNFWDRLFEKFIIVGGVLIIVSVLGILLIILKVALPLFYQPQAELRYETDSRGDVLYMAADDYLENLATVYSDLSAQRLSTRPGVPPENLEFPLADEIRDSLLGFDTYGDGQFAALTEEGGVYFFEMDFAVSFEGSERVIRPEIVFAEKAEIDLPAAGETSFQARRDEEGGMLSVVIEDGSGALEWFVFKERGGFLNDGEKELFRHRVEADFDRPISIFRLSFNGESLWYGSDEGHLEFVRLSDPETPETVLSSRPVLGKLTSLHFLFGDESVAVADDNGSLNVFSYFQDSASPTGFALSKMHEFRLEDDVAVSGLPLLRDKTVVSLTGRGDLRFHYSTSERNLIRIGGGEPVKRFALNERGNGLVTLDAGNRLKLYLLDIPHPESSFKALFGSVFYENYQRETWTWQSSSGSDEFESKYSLVPLIFGSLKGTLFAMLFALPLSIIAALYISQFTNPFWKKMIKPGVEIMAALPSVVVGFLAALWLAPLLEDYLMTFFLSLVLGPPFFFLSFLAIKALNLNRVKGYSGNEFLAGLPLMALWLYGSNLLAPTVEAAFFGGNVAQWFYDSFGVVYDQRNSIVISFALGFAVIPIIFTIAEDSISNVPRELSAGSLALGATKWQTACRIIIPTASPGIFVAGIIGFGRAIGETMIVLMATGNTPILDWNVFQGMRTLSANIAVEIPEAPVDGTLYRILFLSAVLLFLFTFVLNAAAEIIRLRLRKKYGKV